ncbi:hypothetical protein Goklo_016300, partial [Gossypium klotzschianum]|nr:hypothetical protein [Gossypium klotzschianum]
MRLTYTPFVGNLQELAKGYMDSFTPKDCDEDQDNVSEFVEAMIYSPTEVVFMTGRYASKEETKKKGNNINSLGWRFKPWFYQHAKSVLKKGEFLEYILTREYYHRHTRHLSWEGKPILPFGDQWWFRFLLGWLMPSKVSLLKGTQREAIRNYYREMHAIQDMLVPLYEVGDALEWVHQEIE